MKRALQNCIGVGLAVVLVSSLYSTVFAGQAAMTPEVAAKAERSKRQQAERITPAQRRAAAEAIKQKRLKIYEAKHGNMLQNPANLNNSGQDQNQRRGHEKP